MKKIFSSLFILFILFGCGIDDDDSCRGTTPIITDVVFFTCDSPDFNPEHEDTFNVGDEFDVIIYATDCDLDMDILYFDLEDYDLPEQVGVDRGYHFQDCFIIDDVPAGLYIVEFQIEDSVGHRSNTFPVKIKVQSLI